jgi:hypothetical protein
MIVPSAQVGLEKVKRTLNKVIAATIVLCIFFFIVPPFSLALYYPQDEDFSVLSGKAG